MEIRSVTYHQEELYIVFYVSTDDYKNKAADYTYMLLYILIAACMIYVEY